MNASARVIITTFPALFFSFENLKNSPVLNAINARAISARNSVPVIIVCGIKFKQNGPIRIPVTIYAVTLGNFNFFVIRVIKKPQSSIIAIAIMITATGDCFCNLS